jgi:hypothetical protein
MIILGVYFHGVTFVAVEVVEIDDFLMTVDHTDLDAVYDFLNLDFARKFKEKVLLLVFFLTRYVGQDSDASDAFGVLDVELLALGVFG